MYIDPVPKSGRAAKGRVGGVNGRAREAGAESVRMEVDVRSTYRPPRVRQPVDESEPRRQPNAYEYRRSDEPSALDGASPHHIQSYCECHAVSFVFAVFRYFYIRPMDKSNTAVTTVSPLPSIPARRERGAVTLD